METSVNEQIEELATTMETLDQKDLEGKAIVSGWMIVALFVLVLRGLGGMTSSSGVVGQQGSRLWGH